MEAYLTMRFHLGTLDTYWRFRTWHVVSKGVNKHKRRNTLIGRVPHDTKLHLGLVKAPSSKR
jgi:hypothetical protein